MSGKRFFRQQVFRWHRVISLLVVLPVLLWSLTGFLHPVMSRYKPKMIHQTLAGPALDMAQIRVPLQEALTRNGIRNLQAFRMIHLNGSWFYQVKEAGKDSLRYIHAGDGRTYAHVDHAYAIKLAEEYRKLLEPAEMPQNRSSADVQGALNFYSSNHPQAGKIKCIRLVRNFSPAYKKSNVLLPVYEITFNGKNQLKFFVETSSDRLALATNRPTEWFATVFANLHSWSFLDGYGKQKEWLLGGFSVLCLLTCLFGFYIRRISSKKKNSRKSGRIHRMTGTLFLCTTLLFPASAAWHAFHKLPRKAVPQKLEAPLFSTSALPLALEEVRHKLHTGEQLMNVSVIRCAGKDYWQLQVRKGKETAKRYLSVSGLSEWDDGDLRYGHNLACRYSGRNIHTPALLCLRTSFNQEYSMMNKILPVAEVRFPEETWYIETGSGKVVAVMRSADKAERFSFSNFHMHHYWESWLGKDTGRFARNIFLEGVTLGLLVLAGSGLVLYVRKRRKKDKDVWKGGTGVRT